MGGASACHGSTSKPVNSGSVAISVPHRNTSDSSSRGAGRFEGSAENGVLCGGDRGARTPDLLHAMQALSQLSYIPTSEKRTVKV